MHKQIYRINREIKKYRYLQIHPTSLSCIKFCESFGHGEIVKLKIQDGLPMLTEEAKKKIKFTD